ncbi:hypothetical protein BT69DRAFT_1283234 [Atractiella rhizophila]|nr:hypothetical protein BT69DRAFT_1283234 [Atractiella rhizophila]
MVAEILRQQGAALHMHRMLEHWNTTKRAWFGNGNLTFRPVRSHRFAESISSECNPTKELGGRNWESLVAGGQEEEMTAVLSLSGIFHLHSILSGSTVLCVLGFVDTYRAARLGDGSRIAFWQSVGFGSSTFYLPSRHEQQGDLSLLGCT